MTLLALLLAEYRSQFVVILCDGQNHELTDARNL